MATVLTGQAINQFQAKVLLSALKLEVLGMKRNGRSAYSLAKERYNLTGNKQTVYYKLCKLLEREGKE
jgi:hypothetical protein